MFHNHEPENQDLQPTTMQSNLPREELPEQDLDAVSGGDAASDAMAAHQDAMVALAEQNQAMNQATMTEAVKEV